MHSRGPHGASPILSSTWSISHLSAIHTTSNKTRQRILQPSMGLFFLARNTKNIMHIIWAAPPSHYPREKDSHASGTWSHTTSINTSSPWLSCLKIAMICNWRTASQLVSWPPWLWLPFSACFWHSHSTGWGFFGFFSFLPLLLCACPNSCLPLCPLTRSIDESKRKEVTEHLAASPHGHCCAEGTCKHLQHGTG